MWPKNWISIYLFIYFWYWGVNSRPGACQVGAYASELNPQPLIFLSFPFLFGTIGASHMIGRYSSAELFPTPNPFWYDSIYTKFTNKQNQPIVVESQSVFFWDWEMTREGRLKVGKEELFIEWRTCPIPCLRWFIICQNIKSLSLTCMHFIVNELYLC